MGNDVCFVLNDPLDNLALLQLHRFGQRSREVDVVLISGLLPFDELDFGRIPHGTPPLYALAYMLDIIKPKKALKHKLKAVFQRQSYVKI
jgi:hypothetical protein